MKALVFKNKVVQLEEQEFPVHSSMSWLEAPQGCAVGWELVNNKLKAPVVEEEIKTYSEKRQEEYGSVAEQLDMLYWDLVNETGRWKQHIAAVKAKYPKD